ncbi:MAG: O-antigen ligase family protein [Chitinophagales bacterium]
MNNPLQKKINYWLKTHVLTEKLNNILGIFILTILALSIAYISNIIALKGLIAILLALVAIPSLLLSITYLQIGLSIIVIISFFLLGIKKLVPSLPLGITLDVYIYLMFFMLIIKQLKSSNNNYFNNPITYLAIIWLIYNFIELFNPIASSQIAWFYTVRSIAGQLLLYFISLFVLNSLKITIQFIKLILGLSFLAALYGLYQEFFGLMAWERQWLFADMERYHLYFQWGRLRIFSFISDPMTFGILMANMGLFCFILVFGPFGFFKKIILLAMCLSMFLASAYSGTRTAFAIIPIGVIFFTFISMKREVWYLSFVALFFGTLFMLKSTGNPVLYRIQSAFKVKDDPSMQVRLENQAFIQPFIQQNPIGGGLGSTGAWGKRFSPNTMLANFPPDSGYVRIAIEQGWIGLLIYCCFLFFSMKHGIQAYFRTKNETIRIFYMAFLTLLFNLCVTNYTQEVIMQIPTSVIFYITLAALVRLKTFDGMDLSSRSEVFGHFRTR